VLRRGWKGFLPPGHDREGERQNGRDDLIGTRSSPMEGEALSSTRVTAETELPAETQVAGVEHSSFAMAGAVR
jgi:hypothetical protein